MQHIILIVVGGSLGAVARYGLSTFVYNTTNDIFPYGTLAVNVTGSFLIGVFIEIFDNTIIPSEWRSFITIGFLGAYTTFSTYTLETINLFREGEIRLAAFNVLANNLIAILFVIAGIYSSRLILKFFA